MPTPDAPASGPLPSPTWCYRCGYNLGGLSPEGVCPECGLDIAASWPVWDLRACHRVYRDQVRAELWWIGWSAALFGLATLAVAVVLAAEFIGLKNYVKDLIGMWSIAFAALAILALALPMSMLERRWRRHPHRGREMARAPRRTFVLAVILVATGLCAFVLPGAFVALLALPVGVVMGIAGAIVILAGGVAACLAGFRHARLVLERAGEPTPPRWLDWAWIGIPLALSAIAAPLPPFVGMIALIAVASSMAVLVWRCMRASVALTPT